MARLALLILSFFTLLPSLHAAVDADTQPRITALTLSLCKTRVAIGLSNGYIHVYQYKDGLFSRVATKEIINGYCSRCQQKLGVVSLEWKQRDDEIALFINGLWEWIPKTEDTSFVLNFRVESICKRCSGGYPHPEFKLHDDGVFSVQVDEYGALFFKFTPTNPPNILFS